MNRNQFLYNNWKAEDEEEEKEEAPKSDIGMFSKKLEKYFFEKNHQRQERIFLGYLIHL